MAMATTSHKGKKLGTLRADSLLVLFELKKNQREDRQIDTRQRVDDENHGFVRSSHGEICITS